MNEKEVSRGEEIDREIEREWEKIYIYGKVRVLETDECKDELSQTLFYNILIQNIL